MNISFQNKVAIGLIVLAAVLVAMWRYEFRAEQPRHKAMIASLQSTLQEREHLSGIIEEVKKTRANIERVAAQGRIDDSVGTSLTASLNTLLTAGDEIFPDQDNPFEQLSVDAAEFFKIVGQLALYEGKINEFIDGFGAYFQNFENKVAGWKKTSAAAIATGATVADSVPFAELGEKISAIERAIPEFASFKQRLKGLETGFDGWVKDINAAPTVAEKQAVFAKRQFLLIGIPELFRTFNTYAKGSLERERTNVQSIAQQIIASLVDTQHQVEEKYAVKNNSVQTIMAQTKYKDDYYRKVKYAVTTAVFVCIIALFFMMTIYSFRFEKGLAVFRRKTFEAAQTSREISSSLKDNSDLTIKNFDLARTLKEGLADVSQGFLARQNNLQQIDQLVRDTDSLIKESQENFVHIKDEFYNAEKISKEIVNLTGALEGVAQQVTSVAETLNVRDSADPQAENKEKTIGELKYLAGRIRYAVNSTHETLNGRAEKIEEAKAKLTLIESNMAQMTENTKQALRNLALARLDHSEEANRVNEILDNAKNASRVIATEIEALNRQITDFSVLSKHLAALHELAVKASALNAQSFFPEKPDIAETTASSQRMNAYVQEYFRKIFESTVALQANETTPPPSSQETVQANRIPQTSATFNTVTSPTPGVAEVCPA